MPRIGSTVAVRGLAGVFGFLGRNETPNIDRLHFQYAPHDDIFWHGFTIGDQIDLPLEITFAYAETVMDRFVSDPEFEGFHDLRFEPSNSLVVSWDLAEDGSIRRIL